jgi:hypothetical protein
MRYTATVVATHRALRLRRSDSPNRTLGFRNRLCDERPNCGTCIRIGNVGDTSGNTSDDISAGEQLRKPPNLQIDATCNLPTAFSFCDKQSDPCSWFHNQSARFHEPFRAAPCRCCNVCTHTHQSEPSSLIVSQIIAGLIADIVPDDRFLPSLLPRSAVPGSGLEFPFNVSATPFS